MGLITSQLPESAATPRPRSSLALGLPRRDTIRLVKMWGSQNRSWERACSNFWIWSMSVDSSSGLLFGTRWCSDIDKPLALSPSCESSRWGTWVWVICIQCECYSHQVYWLVCGEANFPSFSYPLRNSILDLRHASWQHFHWNWYIAIEDFGLEELVFSEKQFQSKDSQLTLAPNVLSQC